MSTDTSKQGDRYKKITPLLIAGVLFVIGHLLLPISTNPDSYFSLSETLGTFLIFVLWLFSTASWGKLLARIFGVSVSSDKVGLVFQNLCFGAAFMIFLSALLGHLHLIHYSYRWLHWIILLSPILVFSVFPGKSSETGWIRPIKNIGKLETVLLGLLFIVFMIYALRCSLPHGHTDPLRYHLMAPRYWVEQNHIRYNPNFPWVFQATYWDYLYIWGQSLFASKDGRGLIEGQLFAQWCHLFLGLGGSLLGVFLIFRELSTKTLYPTLLGLLASISVLSSQSLSTTFTMAKNDLGSLLFLLFGSFLMVQEFKTTKPRESFKFFFLSIASFSMAIWIKLTAVFPVIGLCLFWLIQQMKSREPKLGLKVLGAFLIFFFVGLPLVLRNYIWTENPVFPYLPSLFPRGDLVAEAIIVFLKEASEPRIVTDVSEVWARFIDVFSDSYLTPLSIFAFVVLFSQKERLKLGFLISGVIFGFIWYPFLDVQNGFLRWAAFSLSLLPAVGVWSLCVLALKLTKGFEVKKKESLLTCAGLIMLSFLIFQSGWQGYFYAPHASALIRTPVHIGGASKAWLRKNVESGDRVLSTGDSNLYYISHLKPVLAPRGLFFQRMHDKFYKGDVRAFLVKLKSQDIRYLLDSRHWSGGAWGPFSKAIHELVNKEPGLIVFESKDSFVIDLKRL